MRRLPTQAGVTSVTLTAARSSTITAATPMNRPPGSAQRVLTYDKASDTAVWEGKTVRRGGPIPE